MKVLRFITVILFACLIFGTNASAMTIQNGDGFGFSTRVNGEPLSEKFTITGFEINKFAVYEIFAGQLFDGTSIWTIGEKSVAKFDKVTGESKNYFYLDPANSNMSSAQPYLPFSSGVFDGKYIWLIPASANIIARINPKDGVMDGFSLSEGENMGNVPGMTRGVDKFEGATFDGTNIWLVPQYSNRVVKFNTTTYEMKGYPITGENIGNCDQDIYKFRKAAFDGTNVWLLPFKANRLVKVDPNSGGMTFFDMAEGVNGNTNTEDMSNGYDPNQGVIFDGTRLWIISAYYDHITEVNISTGTLTGHPLTGTNMENLMEGNEISSGAAFDGESIWIAPSGSNRIIRFNVATKISTGIDIVGTNLGDFVENKTKGGGAVFDGTSIWFSAGGANRVVRISPLQHTLQYNPNTVDGTSEVPADQLHNEGAQVTIEASITRNGYQFKGWNLSADGTGAMLQYGESFSMPTSDTTFYAIWEKNPIASMQNSLSIQTGDSTNIQLNLSAFFLSVLFILGCYKFKKANKSN